MKLKAYRAEYRRRFPGELTDKQIATFHKRGYAIEDLIKGTKIEIAKRNASSEESV